MGNEQGTVGRVFTAKRWVITVVVVGVLARTVVASCGWFYWDDLTLLAQAQSDPLPEVLFRDHDGHLMPAAWCIYWLLAKTAPLAWPPAVAVLFLLNLGACAAVAWLCWTIAPRRTTALPVALYVATPLTLPSTTWLAAAVNGLPLHAATAMIAATTLRFACAAAPGREMPGRLAALAGWTLVGCSFNERIFFTAPLAIVLAWCLRPGRRVLHAAAAVALPLALWAGVYVAAVGNPTNTHSFAEAAGLFRHGVFNGLIPTAAGGPWLWERWIPSPPWATPPLAGIIAGVCVLAVTLWWSRSKAWLPAMVYPLLSLAALALIRNGPDTAAEIAQTLRHYSETAVFAAAALSTANWSARLPQLISVAVIVSSAVSTATYTAQWHNQPGRAYFHNLRDELAQTDDPVLNQPVDFSVLTPVVYPDNQLERIVPSVKRWSGRARIVKPDGTLTDANLVPFRSTSPGSDCSRDTALPLDGPLVDRDWVVRLNYVAEKPGTAHVALDGAQQSFPVQSGLNQVYVQVTGGGQTLHVDADMCVFTSDVGLLAAQ